MALSLLFPPKCALCRNLLTKAETDLCHHCRTHAPELINKKRNIPFIAQWTALWYYKDNVRKSIHRFKFGNARSYAQVYARMLALKVLESDFADKIDMLAWVPTSLPRRFVRGYDQSELLATALGKELGLCPTKILHKHRHTPPQSRLKDASQRRANIQGAYRLNPKVAISGKRILLLDDVLTTGATASECAKVMLTGGAQEVYFAAVAAVSHHKNKEK